MSLNIKDCRKECPGKNFHYFSFSLYFSSFFFFFLERGALQAVSFSVVRFDFGLDPKVDRASS